MSDYAHMRARIAVELDRTDLSASINREINSAIAHYESMRTMFNEVKDWTVATTVSGTRQYTLTTNFLRMDSLKLKYNDSFIILKKRIYEEMEHQDRQINATLGVPFEYGVYGDLSDEPLRLWPVPNGAYSLVGSYLRSYQAASLTGSATSTASSAPGANPATGWFTFGEELIRQRARAAVKINVLEQDDAKAEMALLTAQGHSFLSIPEKVAHKMFVDQITDAVTTGFIKPYYI